MKPLHDLIMSVASKIAQDGTFDQLKPVKSLIEKMKSRKRFYSFSLDLSAATDRLPIVLQIPLVSALLENYSLLKLTLEEFAELSRV